ncbi:Crp/Fnr family transcriptional regulator [Variovorax sp. dw_308]|uniref:Crp/Fnr family transcriptional regulator n=1 Tax=Variovorax sp. dw_308 TaxID=2721546 RepID=UPI001C47E7CB|nr:Crp/Fnr family transcriptional regulator [Variovorax sp. dw_308]
MNVFDENPWFKALPEEEAEALLAAASARHLAAGEFLFRQGDTAMAPTGAFFGVASGLIKLSILHPDGNEAILTIIEPGNWIGEVAVLEGAPRAHTAIAVGDTDVLAVSADKFGQLMQRPVFSHAIAVQVATRLRLAYGLMGDSALQSTLERIVRRLVLLAHGDVTDSIEERSVITASQDTLAMMLGISRPTLNKELQVLVKRGAIALRYGRIEILDMQLLQESGQVVPRKT